MFRHNNQLVRGIKGSQFMITVIGLWVEVSSIRLY